METSVYFEEHTHSSRCLYLSPTAVAVSLVCLACVQSIMCVLCFSHAVHVWHCIAKSQVFPPAVQCIYDLTAGLYFYFYNKHVNILCLNRRAVETLIQGEITSALRAVLIEDVNFLNLLFFSLDFHGKSSALLSSTGLFVFFFS